MMTLYKEHDLSVGVRSKSSAKHSSKPATDDMVRSFMVFEKDDIYMIVENNTAGRKRMHQTADSLATAGIQNFQVLWGIDGNAPPGSAGRDALNSYMFEVEGADVHGADPLVSPDACCCWNGVRFADSGGVMSSVEASRFTAHMNVWQLLLVSPRPWALVFEDDVTLTPAWPSQWPVAIPRFPADADLIFFNDGRSTVPSTGPHRPIHYERGTALRTGALQGYAISRHAASMLLDRTRGVIPLRAPLDWLMEELGVLPSKRELSHAEKPDDEYTRAVRSIGLTAYHSVPVVVLSSEHGYASNRRNEMDKCDRDEVA